MNYEHITYYSNPGSQNTEDTFAIAKNRALELGIKTIVIASISGETGLKAVEAFDGFNVIVVSHNTGYAEPNVQQMNQEIIIKIKEKGAKILTTTSAFGGLSRSIQQASLMPPGSHYVIGDIVANTLRIFGQGTKVDCEIASMAADSGLVRTDEDIISIAGTNLGLIENARGADTALVVQPANVHLFFQALVVFKNSDVKTICITLRIKKRNCQKIIFSGRLLKHLQN